MQPKFNNRSSFSQTLGARLLKILILLLIFIISLFLIEKINFPSPKQNIKKDITNEIIKLK
tara:strand:+ start:52 stop:234 length:183 start_codon:yes stop_codon:yes gene_type:complete